MNKFPSADADRSSGGAWRAIAARLSSIDELSSDQEQALANAPIRVVNFERGDDVFVEGDSQTSVYFCSTGWGARYKILVEGKRQIIDFLLPGTFFGSFSDEDGRHTISARAIDKFEIAVIDDAVIHELGDHSQAILSRIALALTEEETRLRERVVSLGRRTAEQRIGHLLLELHHRLSKSHPTPTREGDVIRFPVPQLEIADLLGLTSVHVSRTMRSMSERGLIDYNDDQFAIQQIDELMEISDFNPGDASPLVLPDTLRQALLSDS